MIWAWGAVEADFARYYGTELNEVVHGGTLTWRRFKVLLAYLPPDSAWGRFLADEKSRSLVDTGRKGQTRL